MALTEEAGSSYIPEWTFGDRLRKAREMAGLDRIQMAERLHVSDSSVGGWERGDSKPRDKSDIVHAWAEATGVDPVWLMFGEQFRCSVHPLDMPAGQMELALGIAPRHLAVAGA